MARILHGINPRVRNYIKNQDKREYIQEWDNWDPEIGDNGGHITDFDFPTSSEAEDRADKVPSWKFIYLSSKPEGNAGLEN